MYGCYCMHEFLYNLVCIIKNQTMRCSVLRADIAFTFDDEDGIAWDAMGL